MTRSVVDAVFFDTNVLLYLLSADTEKADIAEQLLAQGGSTSVQALNEFTNVSLRKLRMPLADGDLNAAPGDQDRRESFKEIEPER